MTQPVAPAGKSERTSRRAGFRPDIQGLRAVAVLLVALCHADVAHLAGGYVGVDVFFVISGFLITGWILRHSERSGHVPLWQFYAARARRILPAAALTLVATTIACRYLLNFIEAQGAFHDSVWAAFFAANIHFAREGTNYFSSTAPPSPLQHYWSLAVEEQFYLVWPALVMLVLAGPRLLRRPGRRAPKEPFVSAAGLRRLAIVLGICVVASLVWSIADTASDPVGAYFSTFARAFELGIGGLLSVTATQLSRIPLRLRLPMTFVGLAGIGVAATAFSSNTAFPGYAALLPVLSAALVIIGGLGDATHRGASRWLGRQPLRFVGDASYSFYLWHWPVLIVAAEYEGHDLTVATNLLLLAAAFALSAVTYLLYENPIHHGKRFGRPWAALTLWPASVGAVLLAAALGLSSIQAELRADASGTTTTTTTTLPGTTLPGTKPVDPYVAAVAGAVTPATRRASVPPVVFAEMERFGERSFQQCVSATGNSTSSPVCHLGTPHAPRTVVVFGDSHAQALLAALDYFGRSDDWQVVPLVKQGCVALEWSSEPDVPGPTDVLGAPNLRDGRNTSCNAWQIWAVRELKLLRPDAIVYATAYAWGANVGGADLQYDVMGLENEIDLLEPLSPRLVLVQDTPYWNDSPVQCLLQSHVTLGDCTYLLPRSLLALYSQVEAAAERAGAKVLPMLQWFCSARKCPPVVDDNVVYRDREHVSINYSTYLETPLSDELEDYLR